MTAARSSFSSQKERNRFSTRCGKRATRFWIRPMPASPMWNAATSSTCLCGCAAISAAWRRGAPARARYRSARRADTAATRHCSYVRDSPLCAETGGPMAVEIPYVRDIKFDYGACDEVSPLIRRVVAENPSAFTYMGTGTYIIGHGEVAVVDPGPMIGAHVEALLRALEGETVSHILITHTHSDHSPAAKPLKALTGAQTYAFGPHGAGQKHASDDVQVEEDGDMEFVPDVEVRHGDIIEGDGWTVECVYTP